MWTSGEVTDIGGGLKTRGGKLASADVVEIQGDTVCVVAVQSGVVIGPVGPRWSCETSTMTVRGSDDRR